MQEKTPVHVWEMDDKGLKVIRQKPPRFTSYYRDGKFQPPVFLDGEEPPEQKINALMKKAEAFMKHHYFNKN